MRPSSSVRRYWRTVALLPLALLVGGSSAPPSSFASVRPDAALIDKGDLGVATYAMLFVIVALLVDRFLERRATGKLADAIDRRDENDAKRHTALLVQLSVLASVVGSKLPSLGNDA